MRNNSRNLILWLLIFSGVLFFVQSLRKAGTAENEIPYSQFKHELSEGKVSEVRVREDVIRGRIKTEDGKLQNFRTIPMQDPNLVSDLEKARVEKFAGEQERNWVNAFIMNALWIGVFFFLWWFLIIRQMQGG